MEQKLSVVGIDLAKQVFHHVGINEHGRILVCKRLYCPQVMAFIAHYGVKRQDTTALGGLPFNREFTLTVRLTGVGIAGAILFCNVTLNTVLPLCVSGMVTLVAPLKSPALVVTVTVLPCVIGLPFWSETM